jgi:DNA-binding NtrC family response regulator
MESYSIRGSHPVMRSILSAAERIAGTDICVLIVGEKGTGKDLLARYIHAASPRASGPFVRVDCRELGSVRSGTALSGALAHEFAGDGMAYGLRERARGGTLFLDQISALGNELQSRLLSMLRAEPAPTDVRLLASRDPADALPSCLAAAGLALVEIPVPPLRQRRSDIPLLVEHFLELYVGRHGVPPRRIDTEAMVQLWQYDWPGNVRELENLVERVVVLNRSGVIRAADLPRHVCTVTGKAGDRTAMAGNGCGIAPAARHM